MERDDLNERFGVTEEQLARWASEAEDGVLPGVAASPAVKGSAQKRYRAKNIVRCTFDLNRATDADLIAHLQSHPNRAAYLKELIRRDMEYTYEVVPLDEGDEGA